MEEFRRKKIYITMEEFRRKKIIQYLITGKSQPEIASLICVSLSTIEKDLKFMKKKHKCKTLHQLIWKLSGANVNKRIKI